MKKLRNKVFRDAYLAERVRSWIAYQITALRHQRGLTQKDLAELTGTHQSVISRVEDPDYGPVKLSTLLSIASALDIGLAIKFVPFSEVVSADLSPINMQVQSFEEEANAPKDLRVVHLALTPQSESAQHQFAVGLNSPVLSLGDIGTWAPAVGGIAFRDHNNRIAWGAEFRGSQSDFLTGVTMRTVGPGSQRSIAFVNIAAPLIEHTAMPVKMVQSSDHTKGSAHQMIESV